VQALAWTWLLDTERVSGVPRPVAECQCVSCVGLAGGTNARVTRIIGDGGISDQQSMDETARSRTCATMRRPDCCANAADPKGFHSRTMSCVTRKRPGRSRGRRYSALTDGACPGFCNPGHAGALWFEQAVNKRVGASVEKPKAKSARWTELKAVWPGLADRPSERRFVTHGPLLCAALGVGAVINPSDARYRRVEAWVVTS